MQPGLSNFRIGLLQNYFSENSIVILQGTPGFMHTVRAFKLLLVGNVIKSGEKIGDRECVLIN